MRTSPALRRRDAGPVHRAFLRDHGRARPRACWSCSGAAPWSSTTETTCAARPGKPGSAKRSRSEASCPLYIRPLFCEGKGPFRWAALSGDPEDIRATDRALLELFPENAALRRWLTLAQERVAFQGLPARICWLGYGERARAGLLFNELVRAGKVSAPIVIGRDHLDAGSVASPNRETEGMRDGSDAIADWPILNALLNTACGATLGLRPPWGRRGHRLLDPCRDGGGRRRDR